MIKTSSEDQTTFLKVGTEVSAKYRGAFCEAKVKQVDPCVKCKVAIRDSNVGVRLVDHTAIRGGLDSVKLNAEVEVASWAITPIYPSPTGVSSESGHSKRNNPVYVRGTLIRVTDASVYSVEFNDGDERTLRRSQLVLKGDKHFEESSTLDQLPLHNPEQFGTPVINRRRARVTRNRDGGAPVQSADDSGSESGQSSSGNRVMKYSRRLAKRVGEVVRIGSQDAPPSAHHKGFPFLVVVPSAYPNLEVRQNQLLVKSYRDKKFNVVDSKSAIVATRDELVKEAHACQGFDKPFVNAVERALMWLDSQELPHSWSDHETLFGVQPTTNTAEDGNEDSCDSDSGSTTQEQKDHWLAMLFNFMDSINSPINKVPTVANKDLDLYRLSRTVRRLGGSQRVSREMKWSLVAYKMRLPHPAAPHSLKQAYGRYLQQFEDFNRKLGSESMSFPSSGRRSSATPRSSSAVTTPRERRASQSSETTNLCDISGPGAATPTTSGHKRKMSGSRDDSSSAATSSASASGISNLPHAVHTSNTKEKRPTTLSLASKLSSAPVSLHTPSKSVKKKGSRTPAVEIETFSRRSLRADVADKFEERVKDRSKMREDKLKGKERGEHDIERMESHAFQEAGHEKDNKLRTRDEKHTSRSRKQVDSGRNLIGTDVIVKCVEGGHEKVYEARITQAQSHGESQRFNVHYKGWKKRYDEWIDKDRIVEFVSETNPDLQPEESDDAKEDSETETSTGKKDAVDASNFEAGAPTKMSRENRKSVDTEEIILHKGSDAKIDKAGDTESSDHRTRRRRRPDAKQSVVEKGKVGETKRAQGEGRGHSNDEALDELHEGDISEEEVSVSKPTKAKQRPHSKREEVLTSRRSKRYLERTLSRETITSCATSGTKSTNSSVSVNVKSELSSDEECQEERLPYISKSRGEASVKRKRKYDHSRKSKSDDEAIAIKKDDQEDNDGTEDLKFIKKEEEYVDKDLLPTSHTLHKMTLSVRTRRRRRQDSDVLPETVARPTKRLRREMISERIVSSSVSSPLIPREEDSGDSDSASPSVRLTRVKRREAESSARHLDVISGQEEVVSKLECPSTPSTDGMRDDKENTCVDENEEADVEDDVTEEDDEGTEEEEDIESMVTGEDVEEDVEDNEDDDEEVMRSAADTDDFEELEEHPADTNAILQESSTDEASSSVAEGSQTGRPPNRHIKNNQSSSTNRNRRRTVSNTSLSSKEPADPPTISPELPTPTLTRLRPFVRPTPSFIPANLDQVESYEERERILVNSIKACQKRWREVKQEMRELDREDAQRRAKRRRRKLSQLPPVLSAVYPPNVNLSRSNATTPDSAPPVVIASST